MPLIALIQLALHACMQGILGHDIRAGTERTRHRSACLGLLAAMFVTVAPAHASKPPTAPQLRLEPGMHTAPIESIDTDAAGRFVATAAKDGTARVWSRSGELLTTLRPPAGAGSKASFPTVAISPDGATVAVSGFSCSPGETSIGCIYLFDRASGRLRHRISGLTSLVNGMRFSRDGRALAATESGFAQKGHLRVFSPSDGRLLGEGLELDGTIDDMSWGAAGDEQFLAAIAGIKIRLYRLGANGLENLASAFAGVARPSSVSFSPDGRLLAVIDRRGLAVSLLDRETLKPRFSANSFGDPIAGRGRIAWSADGKTLWTTGKPDNKRRLILHPWTGTEQPQPKEFPLERKWIRALAALPDGGVLFATMEPTWGEFGPDGQLRHLKDSPRRNYGIGRGTLHLSPNGRSLQLGTLRFQLDGRAIANGPGVPDPSWTTARQGDPSIATDNRDKPERRLNLPAPLARFTGERPVTITANNESLALGRQDSLRRINSEGREVWEKQTPSALQLNLGDDDRLLVAACVDGTIRWHRYADGAELLALYVPPDSQRWILWTPSGYYDASPGAEELIGFHVNRGKDEAADFSPVARYRASLYRPDVIDAVLTTRDEAEAVKRADAAAGRTTGTKPGLAGNEPSSAENPCPAGCDGLPGGGAEVSPRKTPIMAAPDWSSGTEKPQAVAALRDNLTHDASGLVAPAWHAGVLIESERALASGQAAFLLLAEAKRHLGDPDR